MISGEEEAQLAFRSAARHFDLRGTLDRGSRYRRRQRGGHPLRRNRDRSRLLAAARCGAGHRALVRSDPLRDKHWKQMKEEIDREHPRRRSGGPAHRAEIMIGSGGTFTALAHMSKWQREGRHGSVQGYVLTPAEVIHLLDRLREAPLEARRQIPGLSTDRADIIVAGASVIARLVRAAGKPSRSWSTNAESGTVSCCT